MELQSVQLIDVSRTWLKRFGSLVSIIRKIQHIITRAYRKVGWPLNWVIPFEDSPALMSWSVSQLQVWIPLTWRRSNMIFSSYAVGLFGLFILEFSLWNNFGNYIWYVSIGFTILDVFIGDIISYQLKEVNGIVGRERAIAR